MNPQAPGDLRRGDTRLPGTPVAKEPPAAATPACLASTAPDGSARNIPVSFHGNGPDLIMGAFAGTFTIAALRAHPAVAVTVAAHHQGAKVLLLRGEVTLADVDGLLEEYAIAWRRTIGEQAPNSYLAATGKPGLRMVRIALRPRWAGVLDFGNRVPERTPKIARDALA